MTAYIVIPVVVLTVMAIWFLVYMYDKRFKTSTRSVYPSRPAAACPNIQQEGIVYTISNTNNPHPAHANRNQESNEELRIGPDGRIISPQNGYISQSLMAVSSVPRDLPPSYDQVVRNRDEAINEPSSPT